MKTHLCIMLLLSFPFFSKAVSMGEVIGQITEKETSNPIPFATLIFENNMDKIEVKANEHGYYYAEHIPTGKYQMRVVYNNRTFYMNRVRVYDNYSTQVNFTVSNNNTLPATVELQQSEPMINSVTPTDVRLTNSSFNQPTQSLSELLSTQPGVDIQNGKLYIKGSSDIKFFIDGTPVMGPATIERIW